jgi:hypothetical protein
MEELLGEIEAYLARGERPPTRMEQYLFPEDAWVGYDSDSMLQACAWLLQHRDSPDLRSACIECSTQVGLLLLANALNHSDEVTVLTGEDGGVWNWALEDEAREAALAALRRSAQIFDRLIEEQAGNG